MIYQVGEKRELIIWSPEAITALEPETGQDHLDRALKIHAQSSMSISTAAYLKGSCSSALSPDDSITQQTNRL